MASTVTELLRRRFGGKKSILPQGYTQLNYIENNGATAAMFSITAAVTFSFELEFAPKLANISQYACMFGQNGKFQAAFTSQGKANIGNATSTDVFFSEDVKAKVTGTVASTSTSSKFYVDGVDTGLRRGSTGNVWCLFAATTMPQFPAKGKMYSFKLWNNDDELVMNLIPCIDPNNVYGMYDIINDVFYSSITSTPFTGG